MAQPLLSRELVAARVELTAPPSTWLTTRVKSACSVSVCMRCAHSPTPPPIFVARFLYRYQWLAFFACLGGMVAVTYLQWAGGRFTFQDGYKYDLMVPDDPIVLAQEAARPRRWSVTPLLAQLVR